MKDKTLPTIRVDERFFEKIEWYRHHARIHNASEAIRSLVAMGLQTYKIIVNESDWRLQGVMTQIDSLTPEQREQVFAKLFEEMGPAGVDRIRSTHEKIRHDDESKIEQARKEKEKQNRIADAKLIFERFDMDPVRISWALGRTYEGMEDEALHRFIHGGPEITESSHLSPAFKLYLKEIRKVAT